jgi:hypothetical protein
MTAKPVLRLVTLGGECFEVDRQGGNAPADRDGMLHYFNLTDLARRRGERKISVYRGGPKDRYAASVAEYERRLDTVLLNAIRYRFDAGELTFDGPEGATFYTEVNLLYSDFHHRVPVNDQEIQQFIVHQAYWLSYRYGNRQPVTLEDDTDLEYLGVGTQDMRRIEWLLEEDGLLEKSKLPGFARPTTALVRLYESTGVKATGTEQVFPRATPFDAFKAIRTIFHTATKELLVLGNYVDDSILDMFKALPSQPSIKLLTSPKVPKDFSVAVRKAASQYMQTIDLRFSPNTPG